MFRQFIRRSFCSGKEPPMVRSLRFLYEERGLEPAVAKELVSELAKAGYSDQQMDTVLRGMQEDVLKRLTLSVENQLKQTGERNSLQDVTVTVSVPKEGHEFTLVGKQGETLYDLVKQGTELKNYLECACSGLMSCSTCHVYVNEEAFNAMDPPEDAEMDMLDLAWGYQDNSRLGCQIHLDAEKPPLKVTIPDDVVNYF